MPSEIRYSRFDRTNNGVNRVVSSSHRMGGLGRVGLDDRDTGLPAMAAGDEQGRVKVAVHRANGRVGGILHL